MPKETSTYFTALTSKYWLKPLVFGIVFGVSFFVLFTEKTNALWHELHVIDRTRIQMTRAEATEEDWDPNTTQEVRDAFGTREAFNAALERFFKDKDFEDGDIWDSDESYNLEVTDEGKTCTSTIHGFDTGNDAAQNGGDIILRIPEPVIAGDANRECFEIHTDEVQFDDPWELLKAFSWVDESTIRAYQRGDDWIFRTKEGPSHTGKYYRVSEEGKNCQDFILTLDYISGNLHELKQGTGETCLDTIFWLPDGPGSEVYQSTDDPDTEEREGPDAQGTGIRIGNIDKRSIPPGEGELPDGTVPGQNGDEEVPQTCETQNTMILDFVFCAIAQTIDRVLVGDDGTGGMAGVVDNLLSIDSQQYQNESLKQSWTYFRNIASLALVLIGLIMVIGQAISKE